MASEKERELERLLQEQGIDDSVPPDATLKKSVGSVTLFDLNATPKLTPAINASEIARALPALSVSGEGDLLIVERISEGGMGVVELARQRSLARHVAVKRVKSNPPTPDGVASLIGEAQLTGRLEHPNIIPVHALGRSGDNEPLLVMKRVEGRGWRELIAESHQSNTEGLNERELVGHIEILMQVSHALEYAHAQRILHLDIKPENVMVGDFGEVYLLDWGVAIHQEQLADMPSGRLIGTPAYLPPELVFGIELAAPTSDVYLMGATLHEILTGEPRHVAENTARVLHVALLSLPAEYPEHVPEALAQIANKACHPEPKERFQSVAEFREALNEYLLHRGSVALTEQGHDRLEELQAMLVAADEAQVQGLFTECRFAFEQALREWPENASAADGRREALDVMIRYEIDNRRPDVAAALLDALGEERPELKAKIEALRVEIFALRDARERLESLEYAMRVRTNDWKKSVGTLIAGLLWVIGMEIIAVMWRSGALDFTPMFNLYLGAACAVWTIAVSYVFRKALIPNDIHRRFVLGIAMVLVAFVVNRVASVILDIKVEHSLIADYMILFMFMGSAAALVSQARWWVVTALGVLIVLAASFPRYVLDFGAIMILLLNLHYAWDSRPLEEGERALLEKHQNPL